MKMNKYGFSIGLSYGAFIMVVFHYIKGTAFNANSALTVAVGMTLGSFIYHIITWRKKGVDKDSEIEKFCNTLHKHLIEIEKFCNTLHKHPIEIETKELHKLAREAQDEIDTVQEILRKEVT